MSHRCRIMKKPQAPPVRRYRRPRQGSSSERDPPGTDRARPDSRWWRWGLGPRSGACGRSFSRSCRGFGGRGHTTPSPNRDNLPDIKSSAGTTSPKSQARRKTARNARNRPHSAGATSPISQARRKTARNARNRPAQPGQPPRYHKPGGDGFGLARRLMLLCKTTGGRRTPGASAGGRSRSSNLCMTNRGQRIGG